VYNGDKLIHFIVLKTAQQSSLGTSPPQLFGRGVFAPLPHGVGAHVDSSQL